MKSTRPELSRRLGIDADQVLRWQDSEGFAHELLGGRYDGSHLLDYFTATRSTMPYAPNDYASKELAPQPEQVAPEADDTQEAKRLDVFRCVVVFGVLMLGLVLASTLMSLLTQETEQAPVSLMYHDTEQPEPTNYRPHTWQYLD